jgi:hypothetical protein
MLACREKNASHEKAISVAVFAAALLLAGVVASLPVKTLVGIVPDDAFYYLGVGRNIAATGVSTFDGENLASGYHPAWMMLVAAVARCVSANDGLLRIVVATGLVLHAAAGWLLYGCLKRFVSGTTAVLAAGVWMFGYLPLVVASFALETSLYCVAFLLSYTVYLDRIDPYLWREGEGGRKQIPAANLILFGGALGFCLWARTEAIVLLACAASWIGLASLRRGVSWRGLLEACRRGVLIGAAALAAILPWFLYSLHNFGTIRQASGAMKTLWMQGEIVGLGLGERLWLYVCRFGYWLASSLPWTWGSSIGVGVAIALAWLALLAAASVSIKGRAEARGAIGRVLPSVAYPLLHLFVAGAVYSTCFADVQCWYLALPYLESYLVLIVLGGALCRAEIGDMRMSRWRTMALAAVAVFTILSLVRYAQTLQKGYWAWQRDVYASIEPIERALPEGTRVGCFNAGLPGYFSRLRIINLDGLVNEAVVPYWRAKQFDRYLADAKIGVIYDEELSMARARQFSQGLPKLEEIGRYPLSNYVVGTRFLWTLKPAADRRREPPPGTATPSGYGRNMRSSSTLIAP